MTGAVPWCVLAAAAVLLWPRTRRCRPFPVPGSGHRPSQKSLPSRSWTWPGGSAGERRRRDDALGELLVLLAGPLRSGTAPAPALEAARSALDGGPLDDVVGDLVAAAHRGDPLAPVWAGWADRFDSDELRFVARAWALTEETGAPLAEALASALAVVRARRRAAERLASAAAGPRASMLVLLLLPLSGPLVGLACGIDPHTLYLSSPAATGSLGIGVVLALVARWWSARILARAA